jgi:hypothetical protein
MTKRNLSPLWPGVPLALASPGQHGRPRHNSERAEQAAWKEYCRSHPDRRYVAAKRMLNRRELRRHGLANATPEEIARPNRAARPLTKVWPH